MSIPASVAHHTLPTTTICKDLSISFFPNWRAESPASRDPRLSYTPMAFVPNTVGQSGSVQGRNEVDSGHVDSFSSMRTQRQSYGLQTTNNATANASSPGRATSTANKGPISELENARRTVKDLIRRSLNSVAQSRATRESEQADLDLQDHVRRTIAISDEHYKSRDAAVYAVAILHMIINAFAGHHTPMRPTFTAHQEVIRFTLKELEKFPEDVLSDYLDQMRDTVTVLLDPQCEPTELHRELGDRLGRLMVLAQSRRRCA